VALFIATTKRTFPHPARMLAVE